MARKDVFNLTGTAVHSYTPQQDASGAEGVPGAKNSPNIVERPLLDNPGFLGQPAALGAISQSLEVASAKARRADELEQMLAQGRSVVEIDPSLVDPAPVQDRMAADEEARRAFIAAIREQGQQTPILVRLKPGEHGRYQVAYGHRRLDAAREIGRQVLAIVREMSDEELAIAQGQENSVRADLSFIERARFAARLEEQKFSRKTIMAALGADKSTLSQMLTIVTRTPREIIEAIGPAPSTGRPRWAALVELLDASGPGNLQTRDRAIAAARQPEFMALPTDRRFEVLFAKLNPALARASGGPLTAADGVRIARIVRGNNLLTLRFDDRAMPDFGEFVAARVFALYEEYRAAKTGMEAGKQDNLEDG